MDPQVAPRQRLPDVGANGALARLGAGARFLLDGLSLALGRPELRLLAALAVLVTLALFLGLVFVGFRFLDDVLAAVGPDASRHEGFWRAFLEIVQGILKLLAILAWLLVSLYLALSLSTIVCGPLFDLLSERTEKILLGRVVPPPHGLVGSAVREAAVQVVLLGVYVPVVIGIFLLGLVPAIGQVVAPVLAWTWTALWVTLTFLSQVSARHGLGPRARARVLFSNKALGVGFGGPASIIPFLLIPLFAPALVVGGTRLFLALAAYDRVPSRLSEADKALLRTDVPKLGPA